MRPAAVMPTENDWRLRLYVFQRMIANGRAPAAAEIAARFDVPLSEALASLRRLHEAHALVLNAALDGVEMAHPLSAVATDYRVLVDGLWLHANCAWDSLGIPAMLGGDARMQARHPLRRETIEYAVSDGRLTGEGKSALAHFALPFRRWYNDIRET